MGLSDVWPYLVGLAAVIAGWLAARRSGAQKERERQARENLDAVKKAREAERETDTMDNAAARKRAGRWVRSHKRR